MNNNEQDPKLYIMSEVTMPGAEYGIGAQEEVCKNCCNLKKDCTCDK